VKLQTRVSYSGLVEPPLHHFLRCHFFSDKKYRLPIHDGSGDDVGDRL
jgi:hypothetical protein